MSALSLSSPFPIFTDIDGNPLEDGYIYVGTAGLNPETNPISVYWDAALTIPAAQPIRTLGGYPSRSGTAARMYVNADDCSVLVKNKNGSLIFSTLTQTLALPSSVISFIQTGAGAFTRTTQDKLRESVSVLDFIPTALHASIADGTNVAPLTTYIQAAIDAVSGNKGGILYFPSGIYLLGATGLVVYSQITLSGEVEAYVSEVTRGTQFVYSGTGSAILGTNVLNVHLKNISLNCSGTTGTAVRGIYLKGVWLSTIESVRVSGVTPAKGYGILLDTNAGTFGAQHNDLTQIECPDGFVAFFGTGVSDQVTTTTVRTCRGFSYVTSNAMVLFINATAEGSGDYGFYFSDYSEILMLGCDIEGTFTTGIGIDGANAIVREVGTIWLGFTGTTRVVGNMASMRSYGGYIELQYPVIPLNTPMPIETIGDKFVGDYLLRDIIATNISGGTQAGYERKSRRIGGVSVVTHELLDNFRLYTTKSCTTSATAVLTIPVASSVRVSVLAYGSDPGNASNITYSQNAICNNNGGVMTVATDTQLKSPNAGGGISFTTSGTNLIVNFANTTNTATIRFYIDIDGPITGYTKN